MISERFDRWIMETLAYGDDNENLSRTMLTLLVVSTWFENLRFYSTPRRRLSLLRNADDFSWFQSSTSFSEATELQRKSISTRFLTLTFFENMWFDTIENKLNTFEYVCLNSSDFSKNILNHIWSCPRNSKLHFTPWCATKLVNKVAKPQNYSKQDEF